MKKLQVVWESSGYNLTILEALVHRYSMGEMLWIIFAISEARHWWIPFYKKVAGEPHFYYN